MRRRHFGENMGRSPAAKTARNAKTAHPRRGGTRRSGRQSGHSPPYRLQFGRTMKSGSSSTTQTLPNLCRTGPAEGIRCERRAQEADATLRRVFDGTRHAMHSTRQHGSLTLPRKGTKSSQRLARLHQPCYAQQHRMDSRSTSMRQSTSRKCRPHMRQWLRSSSAGTSQTCWPHTNRQIPTADPARVSRPQVIVHRDRY